MSKTLREDLTALLAVQAIDSLIDRAKATIAALDTGSAVAAAHQKKKGEAQGLRDAAKKALAGQHDAEMKLQSIEEKTAQVNKTMYGGTVTSSRELENLQKELAMFGRQKDAAEEEVLIAMDASSAAAAAADTAEAELAALAEQYRKVRTLYLQRHAALVAEIDARQPERAAAAQAVTRAELLARYDALRGKKGGIGAAPLAADNLCGACHTKINTTLADNARDGVAVQVCEYCGRLLVPV